MQSGLASVSNTAIDSCCLELLSNLPLRVIPSISPTENELMGVRMISELAIFAK